MLPAAYSMAANFCQETSLYSRETAAHYPRHKHKIKLWLCISLPTSTMYVCIYNVSFNISYLYVYTYVPLSACKCASLEMGLCAWQGLGECLSIYCPGKHISGLTLFAFLFSLPLLQHVAKLSKRGRLSCLCNGNRLS